MAGDELKTSSRRSHGAGESTRSKRRSTARGDHDRDQDESNTKMSERPQDLDALRSARLKYLATTPEDRTKHAKKTESAQLTSRASGVVAVKTARKRSATSTMSRNTTIKSTRPNHRTGTRVERAPSPSSEDEYVYSRTERKDHGTNRKTEVKTNGNPLSAGLSSLAEGDRKRSSSTRQKPSRRHTEPIQQRDSVGKEHNRTKSSTTTKPPSTRKSTVDGVTSERPDLRRSQTTEQKSASVATESPTDSRSRKSSGLFSNFLSPKPQAPLEKRVSCLTCGADDVRVSKSAKLPCSHRMCHDCLRRIFEMSVTDPAHMPPRCCTEQHIDLKHVDKLFDQNFKKTWNRKFQEYHTKNRIYCPSRSCGIWIKPKYIVSENGRKVGRCKSCGTRVCGICSNKMHSSRDCPKDPATMAFVEVAKENGWQKCYKCAAMIELKEGCNHMTCRCTAEFCMKCGSKWKSCDCPWFNYTQVDGHLGDPGRYQAELDRRRTQEQRDEALARRLQAMGVVEDNRGPEAFLVGNVAGDGRGANFAQQNMNDVPEAYRWGWGWRNWGPRPPAQADPAEQQPPPLLPQDDIPPPLPEPIFHHDATMRPARRTYSRRRYRVGDDQITPQQ